MEEVRINNLLVNKKQNSNNCEHNQISFTVIRKVIYEKRKELKQRGIYKKHGK